MELNVLFIHGAGPNNFFGGHLEAMRNATIKEFGREIYCPPAVDYTETGLIARYLDKWKNPQILIGLSCGCSTVNAICKSRPLERIPYAMYCSPSIWCGLGYVPPNVERATQVTSVWDFFNPGGRMIVQRAHGNNVSVIDEIKTNHRHVATPSAPGVYDRLFTEIRRAQGKQP
jgi:hypothetical protein